jgi:transposase
VRHRGEEAQQDLLWIRARDALVRSRASLVSCARGLTKTMGQRIPTCSTAVFAQRARASVTPELSAALEPLLAGIESHTEQIARYDESIEAVAQRYPETARLREISGVGPLCSLAFVLTLEDHGRFKRSRDVGPYLGLTPRQHQSGESNPQLRITKAGDPYLRRLLVTSAQHILRRHGQDTDLRRFGLRLMERGGKRAKKVAVVAVARKLGVLMHRLWASGESYVPLGYIRRAAA